MRTLYKPYPKYRQSGIEWVREIPEGWEVRRLKFLSIVKRGASPRPIDDPKYFDDEGEYSWVRISDVSNSNKYLEITEQRLSSLGKNLSVPLEPGKLFLSIAGSVGKPIITKIKCCIHDGFVYFPYYKQSFEYLFYIFYSGQAFGGLGKLGTQLNLNTNTVSEIPIPLPPLSEQHAIAAFLDRETARIDAIIAKQTRMIELLKEKRSALITRAVTKGLDPNAKMKKSGVEWIGEIPEGWEVRKVKFIFNFLDNKRVPIEASLRHEMEKNYPYYGASGIIDYVEKYIFDEPLILIGEDGANLLYRSTPLAFLADGKYWVNNHAHILKPKEGPVAFWINVLQSYDYTPVISGSAQPKLTKTNLGKIPLPLPPLEEQEKIALFIEQKTSQIEKQLKMIQKQIELLGEYRQSLITHAVTGKIDVSAALNTSVRGISNE